MAKKIPRARISGLRIKAHVLEMLKQGAAYHGIGYQTYLQWLVEEGLKLDSNYYGWTTPSPQWKKEGTTKTQEIEIRRLMRLVRRNASSKKTKNTSHDAGDTE